MEASDFRHNFDCFFNELELKRDERQRVQDLTLPPQLGQGMIRRFAPRHDMEVVHTDITLRRAQQVHIQADAAMVELSFCFRGAREVRVSGVRYETVPGSCALQLMNRADAKFELDRGQSFHMFGIGLSVAAFHHFIEDSGGSRAEDFYRILGTKPFRAFTGGIDPSAAVILQRLLQQGEGQRLSNLEMECSLLELLSSGFRTLLLDGGQSSVHLTRTDLAKIRQARELMLERMAEPPSLLELSRQVGMNDFKLKKGFKALYGSTVFGYLREKRLEKALCLLQQGACSVIDAACAVGYANPSHFAKMFRERYGVSPGELSRNASSRY